MIINNFLEDIFKVSGLDIDSRWTHWAKFVSSVNTQKKTGYAFGGDFIKPGTVELSYKARVILVASETGSNRYREYNYVVVLMDETGKLTKTEIETDGERGWALRIRDDIEDLVNKISGEIRNPLSEFSTQRLAQEIMNRGKNPQSEDVGI